MRKYALLSALLLAVVFLSGCINQTPPPAGKGLAISSFAPDFSEVRSGETITLSAFVENVGEADAYDIKAQLFGLNIGSEWSIQDKDKSTSRMIGDKLSDSTLRRADSALGLPGESYEFTWTLAAPANLRVDNTYTANLRIYYKYKTSSTSILHMVSYDYLKSLPAEQFNTEKAKAGVTQSTSSAAPVSVKLSAGSRPLVVYGSTDSFSVQIDLTNVDSGNAFDTAASYPQLGSASLHRIYIAVDADDDLEFACSGLQGSAGASWVSLTKGQSKTVFCTIKGDKEKLDNSRDYTVTVTLDYGYYIDASTSVKVLKSEGPVSGGTTPTTPGGLGTKVTSLTLSSSSMTPKINDRITLSGELTYGGAALANKNVKLTIGSTEKTVATDRNGRYEATYTVTSSAEFKVKAEFAGDSEYAKATSSELTIKPVAAIAYSPACKITEPGSDTYSSSDRIEIFYKSGIISSFRVSVTPDSSSNVVSKTTEVSFPKTTSDGKDVTTSADGKTFSYKYDIRTTSDFSDSADATVSYAGGETATCAFFVTADKDKPTTSFDKQQLSEKNYRIALNCADGSGSGCAKTYYCIVATGTACAPSTQYSSPFEKTCTGKCDIKFYSKDNVNNEEAVKTETFGV